MTRTKAAPRIDTTEAADQAIRRIANTDRTILRLKGELAARVANVTAEYSPKIAPYLEVRSALADELEEASDAHPEWFGEQRSLALPHGRIGWRRAWSIRLVKTAETIIAALRARKLPDAIIVKETVDKDVLAAYDDDLLKDLGAKRVPSDKFFIEPAEIAEPKAL